MIISVASGKGGVGKTIIATSLVAALGDGSQLLDCDVEEPNCHLLVKPQILTSEIINIPVPLVDEEKCTVCGKCGEICRFSAIVQIGKSVLTFPEMCHGCGGCMLICPEKAITETEREIGVVETGFFGSIEFVQGRIRIGEAMAPPLIRAVKRKINPNKIAVLDAPPGSSCPVVTTVLGSDYTIMVTEPTPFGLNDLRIAVEAIGNLGVRMGVVLNRSDIGDNAVREYCESNNLPILAEIPHDRRIAEGYAVGALLIESAPEYRQTFLNIFSQIRQSLENEGKELRTGTL